jgi:hypothetical protein
MTVSLKSLVSAIYLPLVLAACLGGHRLFAGLVFSQQFLGFINVPLLSAIGTTAKKNDERVTVFGNGNLGCGLGSQAVKPLFVWN